MRSLQSRDRIVVADKDEPDVYTGERRWILGTRTQPVPSVEKVMRFPKNTTHFVQNGPYSITVNSNKNLFFSVTRTSGNKTDEINLEENIEVLCASPAEGYFLASLSHNNNVGLMLIEPDGKNRLLPKISSFTTTSFEWIDNGNSLLLLVGSLFGQIFSFTISRNNIKDNQLHIFQHKAPISSLAHLEYGGQRYLLVATYLDLVILKWNDVSQPPELFLTLERFNEKKFAVPSFVITNQKYVAWITYEDVRIYTPAQLLQIENGGIHMPFSKLKTIIQIEPQIFLCQLTRPVVMSKKHLIIAAPSVLVGFDIKSLEIAFRFPFSNQIKSIFETNNILWIVTVSHLYKLDLTHEKEIEPIVLISDVKKDSIARETISEGVTLSEMLSVQLEKSNFKGAVQMLTNILSQIPLPKVDENESVPLSEDAVHEICLEFLLYELNIITLCTNNEENVDLKPHRHLDTKGKFDMLASLAHLLRLREFSRAGDKLRDEGVIRSLGETETAVAMLLEKAYSQADHDAHIISALKGGLLLNQEQEEITIPLIPAKREEAAKLLRENPANFKEAVANFFNPTLKKERREEIAGMISEDRKKEIVKLLTTPGLDDKQKDTIVNALDILIKIANQEKLPSLIMRYREVVEKHCMSKNIKDENVLNIMNFSMPYFPGRLSTAMCLEIIKNLAKSKSKLSNIDIALWQLALANDQSSTYKDKELHKILTEDLNLDLNINNVPETYEQLIRRGLFVSAADIAFRAKMYSKAVYAVSLISADPNSNKNELNEREKYIRRFIRMTPPPIKQDLCKKYNITHIDEEEKDGEGPSQHKLVEKFQNLRQQIKDLRKKAAESADFLEQINTWGDAIPQASERCAECGKVIGMDPAYAFPCGHTFHVSCIKTAAYDTLTVKNQQILNSYKGTKLTPEEKKVVEDILLDDCPKCGIASVNLIRIPIVGESKWLD